jgi:hypothetical protein
MQFMPTTTKPPIRAANLLLALNSREMRDVDRALHDQHADVPNNVENRTDWRERADSGGVSPPFAPIGRGYDTSPASFRAACISFNGRAARFAKMTADGNANESHLKGEAKELRNLLTQLIGDGADERADMSAQYRNFGSLTEFIPARR